MRIGEKELANYNTQLNYKTKKAFGPWSNLGSPITKRLDVFPLIELERRAAGALKFPLCARAGKGLDHNGL